MCLLLKRARIPITAMNLILNVLTLLSKVFFDFTLWGGGILSFKILIMNITEQIDYS